MKLTPFALVFSAVFLGHAAFAESLSSAVVDVFSAMTGASQMQGCARCEEEGARLGTVHIGFFYDAADGSAKLGTGSGYLIQDSRGITLVTALHVLTASGAVNMNHSFVITGSNQRQVPVYPSDYTVEQRPGQDEVLLHFKNPTKLAALGLRPFQPAGQTAVGSRVFVSGYPPPAGRPLDQNIEDPTAIFRQTAYVHRAATIIPCGQACRAVKSFKGSAHPDGHEFCINTVVLPGNSGGPVTNEQGQVIGTVRAIDACKTYVEPLSTGV